jgi:hypothetical protein
MRFVVVWAAMALISDLPAFEPLVPPALAPAAFCVRAGFFAGAGEVFTTGAGEVFTTGVAGGGAWLSFQIAITEEVSGSNRSFQSLRFEASASVFTVTSCAASTSPAERHNHPFGGGSGSLGA